MGRGQNAAEHPTGTGCPSQQSCPARGSGARLLCLWPGFLLDFLLLTQTGFLLYRTGHRGWGGRVSSRALAGGSKKPDAVFPLSCGLRTLEGRGNSESGFKAWVSSSTGSTQLSSVLLRFIPRRLNRQYHFHSASNNRYGASLCLWESIGGQDRESVCGLA